MNKAHYSAAVSVQITHIKNIKPSQLLDQLLVKFEENPLEVRKMVP